MANNVDNPVDAHIQPSAETTAVQSGDSGDKPILNPDLVIPVSSDPDQSRGVLSDLADGKETAGQSTNDLEDGYIAASKNPNQLRKRYEDPNVNINKIREQVVKFSSDRGINIDQLPKELKDIVFSQDLGNQTEKAIEKLIEQFFNSEKASRNPEKSAMLKAQSEQYLKLIQQGQREGSLSADLSAVDVYRMVSENVAMMAYQDNFANQMLLGDHGIRHLIGHNINVSMKLADQLAAQGTPISAVDRLILHQAMIYHDLGYAVSPVGEAMLKEGIQGQDAGHNVLAAKIVSERINDPDDLWHKFFKQDDLQLVHRAVLYHDKDATGLAAIDFDIDKNPTNQPEQRRKNIESIARTADNTHTFEGKLPELLYRVPESLKIMRLLKTAGEIGDVEAIGKLKASLIKIVQDKNDFSEDDKTALIAAANSLSADSYKFNVDRICGSNPDYVIDAQGKLHITVNVSEVHQDVISLFGRESYKQLVKFIKDVYDNNLEANRSSMRGLVESANGHRLEIRQRGRKSDYQLAVENIIRNDEKFRDFIIKDSRFQQMEHSLKSLKARVASGEIAGYTIGELNSNQALIIRKRQELLSAILL